MKFRTFVMVVGVSIVVAPSMAVADLCPLPQPPGWNGCVPYGSKMACPEDGSIITCESSVRGKTTVKIYAAKAR